MANDTLTKYSQSSITGESWVRAKRIVIDNPNDDSKMIRFIEEMLINIDGRIIAEDLGSLRMDITDEDMGKEITIIDPTTGEPTGQRITYQELYGILFSAYLEQAALRDSQSPDTTE